MSQPSSQRLGPHRSGSVWASASSRHEGCRAAERHSKTKERSGSTADEYGTGGVQIDDEYAPVPVLANDEALEMQRAQPVQIRTLIHMDRLDHTEYRELTNDWFKPRPWRRWPIASTS